MAAIAAGVGGLEKVAPVGCRCASEVALTLRVTSATTTSPQKMMKVIEEVRSECVVCATRKRMQGRAPSHVSSPIEVGRRPFEVISIDPKPMPYEDKPTGTDSILVVTDRFSGYSFNGLGS